MLIIDENMYRLAKMQETLLKVSNTNKEENLSKYKETVLQIDTKAYADILEEIKHINEHNQSLEKELEFLEKIKKAYDQLLELQSSFKNICQAYGNNNLKLSDLSRLNIDYIEDRINAISGYLINLKNIESNKTRIQELNEQLVVEERKKELLDSRLKNLEETLIYNFVNAEGRTIANEQPMYSQPISVISEYKKLELDFQVLLNDKNTLDKLINKAEQEKIETEDTLKATQFCYNQTPNQVNKQILESTNKETIKVKYKYVMLKILDLVSTSCKSYQDAKKKRERLLELIEARIICLKSLGIHILVEPFTRTKVKEQLDSLLTISDNTQTISDIRKEISSLTARTEEMTNQNNNYLIALSNTKTLIEDSISFKDIDISDVELHIELPTPKEVTTNQVIKVRDTNKINMSIVSQKTESVIKRVNQMINGKQPKKTETTEVYTPDLVIVSKKVENAEPIIEETFTSISQEHTTSEEIDTPKIVPTLESSSDIFTFDSESIHEPTSIDNSNYFNEIEAENDKDLEPQILEKEPIVELPPQASKNNEDLFETITPFAAPTMFNDRSDETIEKNVPEIIEFPIPEILETPVTDTSMSESFWPTQENFIEPKESEEEYKTSLSFDEQIDMLISSESKDSKILKKVA